jgi:hypothetical protein
LWNGEASDIDLVAPIRTGKGGEQIGTTRKAFQGQWDVPLRTVAQLARWMNLSRSQYEL